MTKVSITREREREGELTRFFFDPVDQCFERLFLVFRETRNNKFIYDELDVPCLMVATMSSELQKMFETRGAFDIIDQLKKIFQKKAQTEMCNLTKALMKCSIRDNESVSAHMFKVMEYIEQLEKLGCMWDSQLVTNIVFASLSPRYSNFIMNYNIMGMSKSLDELLGLLKTAEEDMNKGSENILTVSSAGKKIKKCSKSKSKGKGKGKAQVVNLSAFKPKDISDIECFYCKKCIHWKRNCPQFLEDKKNGNVLSSSGILVIEINLATSISDWVLDTDSCAHICSNVQALKNKRLLGKGEIQLRIGNGASVVVVVVGDLDLHLPSGLILELSSVYFVPSISRNIIYVSCMDMDGFIFSIKDRCFSFYRDYIFKCLILITRDLIFSLE
jgi:gag-polypeptide of LTR copia-type